MTTQLIEEAKAVLNVFGSSATCQRAKAALRAHLATPEPTEPGPGTTHLHHAGCGCIGCLPAEEQLALARRSYWGQLRTKIDAVMESRDRPVSSTSY